MTYLIVAYKAVPRSRRPHDHFKVEDMAKRFPGVRNGWATVIARRKDIPDAAELLWLNQPLVSPEDPGKLHAGFGEAAYLVRGCDAWLVWYRMAGEKEGRWVRRPGDV